MAQFVAVWLAVWLMVSFSIDGGRCLITKEEIDNLMEKSKTSTITRSELRTLRESVEEAVSAGSSKMSLESALDVIHRLPIELPGGLNSECAQNLIDLKESSEDRCDDMGFIKELSRSVGALNMTRKVYRELYKYGKSALNDYLNTCQLQERYKEFCDNYVAGRYKEYNPASEPTLADELMNEATQDIVLWAILLVKDSKFGSIGECDNKDFITLISDGLPKKELRRLHEYANQAFDLYLYECGYEESFERVEAFIDESSKLTLASYLKRNPYLYKGDEIVSLLDLVTEMTSVDPTNKRECNKVAVTNKYAERFGLMKLKYEDDYPELSEYAEHILETHVNTCYGTADWDVTLNNFIREQNVNWNRIQDFVNEFGELIGKRLDGRTEVCSKYNVHDFIAEKNQEDANHEYGLYLMEACRQLWDKTCGSLAVALLLRDSGFDSKEDESLLRYYDYCAFVLAENGRYIHTRVEDQLKSLDY